MTPPTLTLIVHRIGLLRIGVTCNASDAVSGVVLLEYYLDDVFAGSITVGPYEIIIEVGLGVHTVKVVVYNGAGLITSTAVTTPCSLCYMENSLLRHRFFQLFYNLFLYYQIFLGEIQD
jgi:hypothetical protein